tara:strand:- start:116 stop:595 length:480 start_codon:yes stop_codon:yes gene_type:complete
MDNDAAMSHHFREWLTRVQGKQDVEVPAETLDLCRDANALCEVLHRLDRASKENANLIFHRVSGTPMLDFTSDEENSIVELFERIYAAIDPSMMLSYNYVLRKIMHRLGFPPPTSNQLCCPFNTQDEAWKLVAHTLGWVGGGDDAAGRDEGARAAAASQ